MLSNFKNYPKKLGQAADEIFRVAACPRSELAVSLRLSVGQVDAEKLAQRSSVAAWVLSYWSKFASRYINFPSCFLSDFIFCFVEDKGSSLKMAFSRFCSGKFLNFGSW